MAEVAHGQGFLGWRTQSSNLRKDRLRRTIREINDLLGAKWLIIQYIVIGEFHREIWEKKDNPHLHQNYINCWETDRRRS